MKQHDLVLVCSLSDSGGDKDAPRGEHELQHIFVRSQTKRNVKCSNIFFMSVAPILDRLDS